MVQVGMRAHLVPFLVALCLAGCPRVQPVDPPGGPETPALAAPEVWAPESQDVCQHVRLVVSTGQGANAVPPAIEADCNAALERVREHYETLSTCLLNTNTVDDVLACERPIRTWTGVVAKAAGEVTPETICEHVMDVMTKELGEALSQSEDERQKFRDECRKEMSSEQAKLGAAEFVKKGTCMLETTNFAAMLQCDEK